MEHYEGSIIAKHLESPHCETKKKKKGVTLCYSQSEMWGWTANELSIHWPFWRGGWHPHLSGPSAEWRCWCRCHWGWRGHDSRVWSGSAPGTSSSQRTTGAGLSYKTIKQENKPWACGYLLVVGFFFCFFLMFYIFRTCSSCSITQVTGKFKHLPPMTNKQRQSS